MTKKKMDMRKSTLEAVSSSCNTSDFEMWEGEVDDQQLVMDVELAEEEVRTSEMLGKSVTMEGTLSEEEAQRAILEARRCAVRELATEKGFWKCFVQEKGEKIYLYVDLE